MSTTDQAHSILDSLQRRALQVGVAAAVLLAVGAATSMEAFYHSYLFGYIFWLSIALGCFGILMLHHLVSGQWGHAIQRIVEAGARTLPLMALLFVPIALGLGHLYPWSQADHAAASEVIAKKSSYLNVPFFLIRAFCYFAFWSAAAYFMTVWSRRQDENGDPRLTKTMKGVAAPFLIAYVLTATFASVDWMMSLEPEWYSTIYGMMIITGQALSAFAFSVIGLRLLGSSKPLSDVLTTRHFHHLGNLLLAFTILWAYMAFSQYLIIWSGNLPEENFWYIHRLNPGWSSIGLLLVIGHFFIPFLVLLSRRAKRVLRSLSWIAAGLLVMHFVDCFWLIKPAFSPGAFSFSWMDIVAPAAVGGFWLSYVIRQLRSHALVALNDPRFTGALEHGSHA